MYQYTFLEQKEVKLHCVESFRAILGDNKMHNRQALVLHRVTCHNAGIQ
jgi:hypothetical protein